MFGEFHACIIQNLSSKTVTSKLTIVDAIGDLVAFEDETTGPGETDAIVFPVPQLSTDPSAVRYCILEWNGAKNDFTATICAARESEGERTNPVACLLW